MRLLHLTFDLPLERRDIAGFRAAVARAAGLENDIFHNHQEEGVSYRYPKIQYRSDGGHAGILGIDEGGDAIYQWFSRNDGALWWNEQEHPLKLRRLDVREFAIRYHTEPRRYRLRQWLPLNQRHYREWQALPDLQTRIEALDRILVAHILTFCRAVNWRLPARLEASVQHLSAAYRTRLMGVDMMGFDIEFNSNLFLPHSIGLGKSVSHGYGVCTPRRLENNRQPD